MLHRPLSYNFKNNVASHRPDRLSRWRRLLMARQAGARAQSRPKSTIEGGQSLFRRVGGVWDARRRHIAGGEKGAEARSRCCSARSRAWPQGRLCSSRGSYLGLYGQDGAASGGKAAASLWACAV